MLFAFNMANFHVRKCVTCPNACTSSTLAWVSIVIKYYVNVIFFVLVYELEDN